ncbi:MAG: hypothetical protein ABWX96_21995 [Propionibacteriaceae bacterium]
MEQHGWSSDDELLASVGDALRSAGAVPHGVTVAGQAAWSWRTIDAELASLVFDSYLEEAAAVRGEEASGARLLIFEGGNASSVEFEVGTEGLVGQLLPPVSGHVSLLNAEGTAVETETDQLGCFVLPLPTGPFRLLCRTEESTFTTEWVSL